ncbi:MAG: hypothetical protein AUH72_19315 [Acidobacteria bacterium 13_1_40CM_4_65_8]|nr:MAG: hypothetical protein AUH72_19315 [Acidobacteria bacterium 13_1_40CM_4_65_8]
MLLATIGTFAIYQWIEPSISLLFFPAVLVPAMYGGYGPGFLATVLSTIVLAYFFVPPRNQFDVGIDDLVRLAVFAVVAFATGWLSSRRRRAEEAQRKSLSDLEAAINTLRKVSGWPVLIAADTAASVRRMLEHAANVAGAAAAAAIWEAEEEPWLYMASSSPTDRGAVTNCRRPVSRCRPILRAGLAPARTPLRAFAPNTCRVVSASLASRARPRTPWRSSTSSRARWGTHSISCIWPIACASWRSAKIGSGWRAISTTACCNR